MSSRAFSWHRLCSVPVQHELSQKGRDNVSQDRPYRIQTQMVLYGARSVTCCSVALLTIGNAERCRERREYIESGLGYTPMALFRTGLAEPPKKLVKSSADSSSPAVRAPKILWFPHGFD